MRDVRDFKKTQTRLKILENTGSPSSTSMVRQVTRSQRTDSQPTDPVGNTFVEPTMYSAFFSTTSERPSEGRHREHQWPFKGLWYTYKWSEDGWADRGALFRHGCDSVTLHPSIPTSCISINRNKVYNQIQNNDLNLGQTIGELRESVRTITDLIRDAAALARALRNPSLWAYAQGFKHVRDARRNITDAVRRQGAREYMRYMWGIRPIISDIYSIADRVANGLGQGQIGRAKAVTIDSDFGPHTVYPTFPNRWFEGEMVRGVETSVTIALTNREFFNLWRYGLTNPLSVVWELTALSFVADWFLHLGSFLSALGGPMGTQFQHGYETKFLRISGSYRERYTPDPIPNRVEVLREGISDVPIRTLSMARERLVGIPVPLPYVDLELNLNEAMGLIALIAGTR